MPGSRVLLVALAPRTINQQPHPTPRPPHAAVVRISQAGWAVAAAVSSQVKSSQGPPLARGHRRCEFLSGRVRNCGDERQRSSREISGAIRIIMRWRQTRVDRLRARKENVVVVVARKEKEVSDSGRRRSGGRPQHEPGEHPCTRTHGHSERPWTKNTLRLFFAVTRPRKAADGRRRA